MSQLKWDQHFIRMALLHGDKSKDPSTKVGAIIVDADHNLVSGGYNGFPRNIEDSAERLNDRDLKLKLVVHGEMNAVLSAARNGIPLLGTTMYVAAKDAKSGEVWGGAPCIRCTVEILQAGVHQIVALSSKNIPPRWLDSITEARKLLVEAGIEYREIGL